MTASSPTTPGELRSFTAYLLALALALAVVFGAAWCWVVLEPMAYSRLAYPMWVAKMEMAKRPARVVVLGDSAATAGIIPDRISRDMMNLAQPGSDPIINYFMARRVLENGTAPQAIILSLTPFQISHNDWFWGFGVAYGLIDAREVEEVREMGREVHDTSVLGPPSPGDIDVRLESFLYGIKFPPYYFAALIHSGFFLRDRANRELLKETFATRGQAYFGTGAKAPGQGFETWFPKFTPLKINDVFLDRTLDLFQAHNIPVYFVSTPFDSSLDYPADFKPVFRAYLYGFETRHPNFHILGDPFIPYPPDHFTDSHHMNSKGAERFSKELSGMMNAAGVPGGPFGGR